jgi:hypothetical protein
MPISDETLGFVFLNKQVFGLVLGWLMSQRLFELARVLNESDILNGGDSRVLNIIEFL